MAIINTAMSAIQSVSGDSTFNVFAQPNLPTDNFDGILLQTAAKESLKKVIFDNNPWTAGQFQNPSTAAAMPETRYKACSTIYNGEIYIFGGYVAGAVSNSVIKYSPISNSYTTLANLPVSLAQACCDTVGNYIYIFGGYGETPAATNNCYRYDITANTFSTVATMPAALKMSSCIAYNNELYIIGGINSSGDITNTITKYSPSSNTYTACHIMPNTAVTPNVTIYNNEIYIFGGEYGQSAQKYTPANDSCTSLANLPYGLGAGICVTIGTIIYIFGGCNTGMTDSYNTIMTFNPSSGAYSAIAPTMNTKRHSASGGIIGNYVYILGGNTGTTALNSTEVYALTAKQYAESPSLIIYRLPTDSTYQSNIVKSSLCDGVPINFKNAMLFKDGNLTFPALYVGNGTQWIKERDAE